MENLVINGTQSFMGKEIPVVSGGFGENKKCISDKTVAEIHDTKTYHVRELINRNINRFKESIDFIDLKEGIVLNDTLEFLLDMGYAKQSITQAEHIYLLSERGYAKLIKIMDTDLAWEIHDKLIDEYFELRDEKEITLGMQQLSPELQMFSKMFEAVAKQELEQKRQAEHIREVEERVDSIREVVALNPTQWRKDTSNLINKIALKLGGYEHIKVLRDESYRLLEQRFGVALGVRLTNRRKSMALNGVSKSKINKFNQLDVIDEDKKLIEGYVAIVKEMAIKYDVA